MLFPHEDDIRRGEALCQRLELDELLFSGVVDAVGGIRGSQGARELGS
jgi:hypothetical protein